MTLTHSKEWEWSSDSSDPCSLCVVWDESDVADQWTDEARPIWPDGSTVPRVYSHIHESCQLSAIAYSMEKE